MTERLRQTLQTLSISIKYQKKIKIRKKIGKNKVEKLDKNNKKTNYINKISFYKQKFAYRMHMCKQVSKATSTGEVASSPAALETVTTIVMAVVEISHYRDPQFLLKKTILLIAVVRIAIRMRNVFITED